MYNPSDIKFSAIIYYAAEGPSYSYYSSNVHANRLDLENEVRAAEEKLTRNGCKITEIVYMERYNFEN